MTVSRPTWPSHALPRPFAGAAGLHAATQVVGVALAVAALALLFVVATRIVGATPLPVVSGTAQLARSYTSDLFVDGFRQAFSLTTMGLGAGINTSASRYAFAQGDVFQVAGGTWYESWYVKVALELGIVGLAIVAALLAIALYRIMHAHRSLRDEGLKAASSAIIAVLLCTLVFGVKAQFLDIDPVNVYFWLFIGLFARIVALDRSTAPGRSTVQPADGATSTVGASAA
jgi:cell division protein FtsW (lipid II flippase)